LEIWSDYSKQGLYVYDYDVLSSSYQRVRVPTAAMNLELKTKIQLITSIVKINVDFSENKKVKSI